MLDPIYKSTKSMNNGDLWPAFGSARSFAEWDGGEWPNVTGPTFTDIPQEDEKKSELNTNNASFCTSEDDEWRPNTEMEDDVGDGDSFSSGFAGDGYSVSSGIAAGGRTSPPVCPISPSKSPRKASAVSHYTMRASITSPIKSPRRRVEHIKSASASSSSTRNKMAIAAPPLAASESSDTSDDSHSKSAEEDAPQQRRLSVWGKMILPRGKRRHSIDGSLHKAAPPALASPRRRGQRGQRGQRRLSFFGNKPTPESPMATDAAPVSPWGTTGRRLSFFGSNPQAIDQQGANFDQEENDEFKIISSIRRRLSLFNSAKTDEQQGTDDLTPQAQDIESRIKVMKKAGSRRHSIDNSMHDAPAPFRRRLSFFGTKIVYDERPDTKTKPPSNKSKKKSKKRSSKRRHSVDGGKAKRRVSFFGSETSKKERKGKKTKISKSSRRRRHSIDGSLHQ